MTQYGIWSVFKCLFWIISRFSELSVGITSSYHLQWNWTTKKKNPLQNREQKTLRSEKETVGVAEILRQAKSPWGIGKMEGRRNFKALQQSVRPAVWLGTAARRSWEELWEQRAWGWARQEHSAWHVTVCGKLEISVGFPLLAVPEDFPPCWRC